MRLKNVNSVLLRLTMKCGSFGAKLNRGRCGLPEQKHGKPCAPKTKQQQKRWWAIAASGCQTTNCTTVLPACLARHFWGCTQIALKTKCSLVKMFYFSKEKHVCIFNHRAEGERLILAMLSYRFVQAKPQPTQNTGLNCRSTSKLAILAPETSGLPVLLM